MKTTLVFLSLILLKSCSFYKYETSFPQKKIDLCMKERDPITCNEIGSILARSYVSEERKVALQFFSQGCNLNYARSCRLLADEYSYNYQNYRKAMTYYKKACEDLKNSESCYYMAQNFRRMDEEELYMKALNKGCQNKDKFSCYDLAYELLRDNQIDNAIKAFKTSCQAGYERACQKEKVYRPHK